MNQSPYIPSRYNQQRPRPSTGQARGLMMGSSVYFPPSLKKIKYRPTTLFIHMPARLHICVSIYIHIHNSSIVLTLQSYHDLIFSKPFHAQGL